MTRNADYPIDPLFTDRWSPRAFDGSAMDEATLMTLLEAARWAPSAYNMQPWRFIYGLRDTPAFDALLAVLIPFNQSWAKSASALVVIASDTLMQPSPDAEAKPSHSHSFDAGAGWASMAFQATRMGFHTHGMSGVDFAKAQDALGVPERFRIECAVAIGRIGDPATLPEPLRGREAPSDRKPLSALAFEGRFGASVERGRRSAGR
ncbi:MAG TPA: nitroreductase family protein [Sphingomonas sp.]|nr:nitroreductase family protein [Sphingomonas sp.]